jgi:hypothetical protein
MFLFYHSEQTNSNKNHYKGQLFEKLLSIYLQKNGYEIELRKKHNSLEYDIEGIDKTTKLKIVGEAKALGTPISGQILSAFVGKLLPLGLVEKRIIGIFLSTSSLTSEADNYYQTVKNMGIISYAGKHLYSEMVKALALLSEETITNSLENTPYIAQSFQILATDSGYYSCCIAGTAESVGPSFFLLYDSKGNYVCDNAFVEKLKMHINELSSLSYIQLNDNEKSYTDTKKIRNIPNGLLLGQDWTDYRLPAAPKFYVGRTKLIDDIVGSISTSSGNIIQIKSRSGVGKSSTLASLEKRLLELRYITELHDSRDIKSYLDIFAVVKRFIKTRENIQDFIDLEEKMKLFNDNLGTNKAIFMVDQFESTFSQPDIFDAYESIASIVMRINGNIFFCLARKNDQLTTYDETKISLEKLNDISISYELKDLTQEESKDLLAKINQNSERRLTKNIISYVMEFAQGFPWLLKRTMAHILKLSKKNIEDQPELIAYSLKLNDIFDEELEGLDEIEKDYLTKIVQFLPADYQQLHIIFDEDPLLIQALDKLTRQRLLRLSGATYDTYNDVLKEYILYKRLPEFNQPILYRMYPGAVLNFFHVLIENRKTFRIDELANDYRLKKGSLFNRIGEFRNLGLIMRGRFGWEIPQNVQDIYRQGGLGEYIRKQLLSNELVARINNKVITNNKLDIGEISNILKTAFPFVDATERTWVLYANVLRAWMTTVLLIEVDSNGFIVKSTIEKNEANRILGNLTTTGRSFGGRNNVALFFPTVSWNYIESSVDKTLRGEKVFNKEEEKAFNDIKNGGWFESGKLIPDNIIELKKEIITKFNNEPYKLLWEYARERKPLLEFFSEITEKNISEATKRWRLKKLLNWAKALKIIPNKRYHY